MNNESLPGYYRVSKSSALLSDISSAREEREKDLRSPQGTQGTGQVRGPPHGRLRDHEADLRLVGDAHRRVGPEGTEALVGEHR